MKRTIALTLALTLAAFAHPTAAETMGDCRAMESADERLACYDGLEGDLEVLPALLQLLGDPEAIDEYTFTGNAETIGALLPGEWVLSTWANTAGVPLEKLLGLCERRPTIIRPSIRDMYSLSAYTPPRDEGDDIHLWDVIWLGGNKFAHARNMKGTLDFYGIDPEQHGMSMVFNFVREGVTEWTYLRLSDDALLLIGSGSTPEHLMLRCPDSE